VEKDGLKELWLKDIKKEAKLELLAKDIQNND